MNFPFEYLNRMFGLKPFADSNSNARGQAKLTNWSNSHFASPSNLNEGTIVLFRSSSILPQSVPYHPSLLSFSINCILFYWLPSVMIMTLELNMEHPNMQLIILLIPNENELKAYLNHLRLIATTYKIILVWSVLI